MIIDLIGWLGTTMIMIGYYLNAKKYKMCFYVWGIGNVAFLIYSYLINAIPQIAVSVFVLGMNVYGYKQWSKDE
ncbi:hypothetical protein HOE22_03320 [Candidatus Woesearchaeota archaeon]|jgi:uncharacterized membrane protein YhfC|nr:hypothetical protein [Candidatus Woesearchaeota archaeon]MBT4732948.1 hypothetical protein [Candidatus Woesearchaeota archaeon]MBT7557352.1 hypothetical protein [Candidatus Woesearchaeota archaeon]